MFSVRFARFVLPCLFAAALAACGSENGGITDPPDPVHTPNFIKLQSEPGDYVGAGKTYEYTLANAMISVEASAGNVRISVSGDQWWSANFQFPTATLQPGTYAGMTRWPFGDASTGLMDWSGDGRGCNSLVGSVTIDSVTYTAGVLSTLDFRFEQHCEGAVPALHGTIHWRKDDKTTPPGPVNPPPAGLWAPPSPRPTGNHVYLQSDPGDYIGGGLIATYTLGISMKANAGHVAVSVGGWTGDFEAMNTLKQLQPGYYGGVTRYPFQNPVKGGLDWYGNGRGCNTLTGWFTVDQVTYANGALTALDLRFEQHCEGGGPALHGAIHWRG